MNQAIASSVIKMPIFIILRCFGQILVTPSACLKEVHIFLLELDHYLVLHNITSVDDPISE